VIFLAFGDHWSLWGVLPPLLFLLRFVLLGRRSQRTRRSGFPLRPYQPGIPPRQPPEADLRRRWQAAKDTYTRTARDYADFECDALAVLGLPDLVDTSVPATARFVEAFAEASALATDRQPPDEHAERFIAAADAAHRAWRAAYAAAERMRLNRFSAEEREALDRAIKLLTVARESGHPGERRAAYEKARSQLVVLQRRTGWTLPNPAVAELERQVQGEIA
jgi:hypothetical protein